MCGEQLLELVSFVILLGIIPACAGSSCSQSTHLACMRDHPRVCGEQPPWPSPAHTRWGSSPRVRGAACRRPSPIRRPSRSRPRGGTTSGRHRPGPTPPRAPSWGGRSTARRRSRASCGRQRRRWTGSRRSRRRWDHPRVCGEQPRSATLMVPSSGSSPRVRGAEHDGARADGDLGIIPACAGSSILQVQA